MANEDHYTAFERELNTVPPDNETDEQRRERYERRWNTFVATTRDDDREMLIMKLYSRTLDAHMYRILHRDLQREVATLRRRLLEKD